MDKIISLIVYFKDVLKIRMATGCTIAFALLMRKDSTFKFMTVALNSIIFLFKNKLSRFFHAETACQLAVNLIEFNSKSFRNDYLFNKLMTEIIRQYMDRFSWPHMSSLVDRKSREVIPVEERLNNLLFFTHTGDYWISILTAAKQYQGKDCKFIVPIYQEIDIKTQVMFDKVDYPGVELIFMHIHAPGALLRLIKYFKDPNCVIAIFYDLSCYVGGIFNGNVEPVNFLNKKGWMTTGILRLAKKYRTHANLVTCHFCKEDNVFYTHFSEGFLIKDSDFITGRMIANLEDFLYKWPYEWHFLSNLDSYFHYPWSIATARLTSLAANYAHLENKYSPNGNHQDV